MIYQQYLTLLPVALQMLLRRSIPSWSPFVLESLEILGKRLSLSAERFELPLLGLCRLCGTKFWALLIGTMAKPSDDG